MTKPRIYIDGEAGTTGLEIAKRLETRTDIEILRIEESKRKEAAERKKLLNDCDLAILCLPDEAALEAVAMIENQAVRVLDASTAHRTMEGWVYGFPELNRDQGEKIRAAKWVSNPGCYPTGALALLYPLIAAGIIPSDYGVTITAVSGYSGGGKELIALCEHPDGNIRASAFCLYGLDLHHKHLPEIRLHSGLREMPIFLPSYSGAFYRGMLVILALRLKELNHLTGKLADADDVHQIFKTHYRDAPNIIVEPMLEKIEKTFVLTPLVQNETNNVQLRVFSDGVKKTIVLTACLDNLGKGASGAAVQNLEIMLGLE